MALHRWITVLLAMPVVACWPVNTGKAQVHERPFNLALRIDCPQRDIRCGDEIPIVFTITSRDPEPFPYDYRTYDRSGRMDEYELVARYLDGRPVPDPREQDMSGLRGGLSSGIGQLSEGSSFQQTIALNLWARITEPGRYNVTGTYHYDVWDRKLPKEHSSSKDVRVRSAPIQIEVKPRSRREMGNYIRDLTAKLNSLEADAGLKAMREREHLAARLAYTCDTRIIPTMLDLLYNERTFSNEDFKAVQAFRCYLPHTDEVRMAVLTAARTRGLAGGSAIVLEHLGCNEADLAGVIRLSLASKDPNTVRHAVLAAQEHSADEHMPRLITIATGTEAGDFGRRESAIYAIAYHRTDEGVATLKTLLNDPNARIRKFTADTIRYAYRRHPVYPKKVDEAFTKALVLLATDPRHIRRYSAIWAIAKSRTPDGVKVVKTLLADPNADVPLAETDLGVRTIRDLLHDSDRNVRERTKYEIEFAYHEYPGRPLQPDDFPAEFREDPETFEQKTLNGLLKD